MLRTFMSHVVPTFPEHAFHRFIKEVDLRVIQRGRGGAKYESCQMSEQIPGNFM
jgi:hypothetical protein